MSPVWDLFKAALGLTVDVTREMVKSYLQFLMRLGKRSIILWLILLPVPIVGSVFHISLMNGLYLVVVTLIMTVWLAAAFPLIMLAQYTYKEISTVRKTAQLIATLLFWGLLLAIYFYLVPVWNYPAAIPLVLIISALLAVGFMRFGIGINPKLAISAVVVVFCLLTISFYMPTSRSAADSFVGWLDRQVAAVLTGPLHPAPTMPARIRCSYPSIDSIVFFDPITSEPRVWYYVGVDGKIELFDGSGYHPQYKEELKPITADIVTQVKVQLKADAEKAAQEEQRRREELEKTAKERSTSMAEMPADANRPKGSRPPKPPLIRPEDTQGRVEQQKDEVIRPKEKVIKPEETEGKIMKPKNG